MDGNKAAIPANIGFGDSLGDDLLSSDCQRTIYTLTDDGNYLCRMGRRISI